MCALLNEPQISLAGLRELVRLRFRPKLVVKPEALFEAFAHVLDANHRAAPAARFAGPCDCFSAPERFGVAPKLAI